MCLADKSRTAPSESVTVHHLNTKCFPDSFMDHNMYLISLVKNSFLQELAKYGFTKKLVCYIKMLCVWIDSLYTNMQLG